MVLSGPEQILNLGNVDSCVEQQGFGRRPAGRQSCRTLQITTASDGDQFESNVARHSLRRDIWVVCDK